MILSREKLPAQNMPLAKSHPQSLGGLNRGTENHDTMTGSYAALAVEMQDRQYCAIGYWIKEFVRMPCGGERTRLRLAVADDAGDAEVGIVKHCPERMAERIAQLAALVDRARTLRRGVAGNAAGKRKLLEELLQPRLILADVGIDLAVCAFEIGIAHDGRAAASGTGDVNHVEVVFLDNPVQMHVDEVLPRGRAPVFQQHVLHIRESQRPFQRRIVVEINLSDRQAVRRTPNRRPSCAAIPVQSLYLCFYGSIPFFQIYNCVRRRGTPFGLSGAQAGAENENASGNINPQQQCHDTAERPVHCV